MEATPCDFATSSLAGGINLLGAINTAEAQVLVHHGTDAVWDRLVETEGLTSHGMQSIAYSDPELAY